MGISHARLLHWMLGVGCWVLGVLLLLGSARAAEPFFKKNDVIALVGGEDMVVASEYGYLEALLTRALPDYHLRFRNLAWEGDTVYEQRRDLNFPSWEEQLDKIGATVVICQFGQMESLDGKERIQEFITVYEKLLDRFSAGGKRRIVVFPPYSMEPQNLPLVAKAGIDSKVESAFWEACRAAASFEKASFVSKSWRGNPPNGMTRDGVHLSSKGLFFAANGLCSDLGVPTGEQVSKHHDNSGIVEPGPMESLRQLVVAKNKLWFDYWRVQNWAFLAGDRTNQPSSRDHRDPSKRWFPAEREEFIPLIEAKEKEIDALAAKLSQK